MTLTLARIERRPLVGDFVAVLRAGDTEYRVVCAGDILLSRSRFQAAVLDATSVVFDDGLSDLPAKAAKRAWQGEVAWALAKGREAVE